jgi:hypothetical protein
MDEMFDAEFRVEHPAPGGAGDDQRNGEGIEEDRAKDAFAALFPVDHGGEDEAEDDSEGAAQAEHDEILQRYQPGVVLEEALVLAAPFGPVDLVFWQTAAARQRQVHRPKNGANEGNQRHHASRHQGQLG